MTWSHYLYNIKKTTIMKTNAEDKKTNVKKEVKQTACSKTCNTKHSGNKKEAVRAAGKSKASVH